MADVTADYSPDPVELAITIFRKTVSQRLTMRPGERDQAVGWMRAWLAHEHPAGTPTQTAEAAITAYQRAHPR